MGRFDGYRLGWKIEDAEAFVQKKREWYGWTAWKYRNLG
jgi:hypothetical protein